MSTDVTPHSWEDWSQVGPGWAVQYCSELDSTNLEASRRIDALDGEHSLTPTWIVAGHQTAGRGRLNRSWDSSMGNFAASLLLPTNMPMRAMSFLSLTVGLAVRGALLDWGIDSDRITLKWPNDVLLDGAKVSGILIEMQERLETRYLIIGIGVNLANAPSMARYKTISLPEAGIKTPLVPEFLSRLSNQLAAFLALLQGADSASLISQWRACAFGLGEKHPVTLGEEKKLVTLLDIMEDASLSVRLDDGQITRLYAGDIG